MFPNNNETLSEITDVFNNNSIKTETNPMQTDSCPEYNQEYEFNKFLQEIKQSKNDDDEQQIADALLRLKMDIATTFCQHNKPLTLIKISKHEWQKTKMAYEHYLKMVNAHITLVMKDMQNDVCDMYQIDKINLLYIMAYNKEGFIINNDPTG